MAGPGDVTSFPGGFDSPPYGEYPPFGRQAYWSIQASDMSDGAAGVTSVLGQTVPDIAATSALTATAGTIFVSRIWVPPLTKITNISVITAASAISTPTNWWFFVSSLAGVIAAITADQLTTALAADTLATVALATPYYTANGGEFYLGVCFAATTGPTLAASVTLGTHGRGAVKSTNAMNVIAASCDTSKTTPPAVGSTLGTLPLGSASVAPFLGYIS